MPERGGPLVRGTLDMLILKTLALEPMHRYGIGPRIERISQGVFHVATKVDPMVALRHE